MYVLNVWKIIIKKRLWIYCAAMHLHNPTHMYVIKNPCVNTVHCSTFLKHISTFSLCFGALAHESFSLLLLGNKINTEKEKMRSLHQNQLNEKCSQLEHCNVACVFAFKARKRYGEIICSEYHLSPGGGY